ncbi:3-methyl-2-oxobutanoate hydroxymethyltransferase [Zunongwangia atlantica]|uniref:Molecular chaperone DnaK n=1 Tax=Zunongwangia atlantica 22II14-10F7 TaxID=1185767 RepID=A0A1Y1T879_9FLAO|nr:3-methyl-2-oxobutanoate hydroxymethyltransferase [Zunongwangia atlantica]ORL46922.1 molecular chaperone DnaK [Zunongwangia atlantica 22II14-10F7]
MKSILYFILLFSISTLHAQSEAENVKNTIDSFFESFHAQDSLAMKEFVSTNVIIQSIGEDQQGETLVHKTSFSKFLKGIVSIPKDASFKEELLDYQISIDGNMANAWTPYKFYFKDNFSHCGVNSFQLVKIDGKWQIIYIIDTRRKEGCN